MLARYFAVIHMHSPSVLSGYDLSNPLRIEDADEAKNLDARVEEAWSKHPRRFFVETSDNFLDKAKTAIALIESELPACCRRTMP